MRPDRMMWSVGLALAVAVLAGLVLNVATGLTRLSWAVALAVAVAAAACAYLVIRRHGADEVTPARVRLRDFRPSRVTGGFLLLAAVLAGGVAWLASGGWPHSPGYDELWLTPAILAVACAYLAIRRHGADAVARARVTLRGFRPSSVTGGFLLLAAVLAGGAVWLANASAGWQHSPGFAQLWMTPSSRTTSTLGVRDNFPGPQTFRLVLRGNGGKVLGAWDLSLTQGQAWLRTVARPAGSTLTARLGVPGNTLTVTS